MPQSERAGIRCASLRLLDADDVLDEGKLELDSDVFVVLQSKNYYQDAGYSARFVVRPFFREFFHCEPELVRRCWFHPSPDVHYAHVSIKGIMCPLRTIADSDYPINTDPFKMNERILCK